MSNQSRGGGVTCGEGGGDVVGGETGLSQTFAAVSVTETRDGGAARVLSGLTTGKGKRQKRRETEAR